MNQRVLQALHPSSVSIFMLGFCWALLGGLLLQLVVLPALPSLHAGHGLLKGGDWVRFHSEAVALALSMSQDGWGIWELRPNNNAPIGMAAALYFVVGIYEPWVFLPVNAFLFGASTLVLHRIFRLIGPTPYSFFAVLPFVMFPSALLIYGQIHKDIFSVTGILLIVFVWMDLAGRTTLEWRGMLVRIAVMVAGLVLVWLVRPYLLQSLLLAGLLAALLLGRWGRQRRQVSWWCALLIFLAIQLCSVFARTPTSASSAPSVPSALSALSVSTLERAVSTINQARLGFALSALDAGSNIDTDVRFTSIEGILLYVPRALQIGLLAPFPSTWLDEGVTSGAGIMRAIATMEMTASYLFLLGWLGLWRCEKERRVTLLAGTAMALVLTLILTLVVLNVGTLYRMRYASWHLLNGFGVLGWGLWLQARRKEKNG